MTTFNLYFYFIFLLLILGGTDFTVAIDRVIKEIRIHKNCKTDMGNCVILFMSDGEDYSLQKKIPPNTKELKYHFDVIEAFWTVGFGSDYEF